MIMGRRKLRIEVYRLFEMSYRFVAPIQDREQETDLILKAGRFGVERGGFFIGGQCAGGITFRFELNGPRFYLFQAAGSECDQGKTNH